MREKISVFVSLKSTYFNTNEFVNNQSLDATSDPNSNFVYIPLAPNTFQTLFNTNLGLSDSENAQNILSGLQNFFNPIYSNNVAFATQLSSILTGFYENIQVNLDKIAEDMQPNGQLFSYFFQSNSTNYLKYYSEPFDTNLDFLQYNHTHNNTTCVFCQSIENIDTTSISTMCEDFYGEYISSDISKNILYHLASTLKAAMVVYSEDYPNASFWDNLSPTDSISIHTRLFIPNSDTSNELNLVIKFYIISPLYKFSLA